MKNLIYILLTFVAMSFVACSKDSSFGADTEGVKTTPTVTPKDTVPKTPDHKWETVVGKSLPIDDNMMATPWIKFNCTDGKVDSVQMEPWYLDIHTADMTIYRDSYQSTSKSGITPDAERTSDPEFKDKFGNMVTRHHYTQKFTFNNFTHSISGAWNTGYLSYNGKQEAFWPEDGLAYELVSISGNTVADTTHFVRNDSIFAKEIVKLTYKATLKVSSKSYTWRSWERTATVTVISFVDVIKHENPVPDANDYIANLEWHAEHANRFWNGSAWCDGILFSSSTHYHMLVTTFKLNHDGTKEEPLETKMYSVLKSVMVTPAAGREFNAVMWDEDKPIPCRLTVDGNGWSLGSKYADGTPVTKRHDRNEAVMSGVKNLSEEDNATPSPWIASTWNNAKYNGANFYTVTWKTTTHTMSRTIADASLKK